MAAFCLVFLLSTGIFTSSAFGQVAFPGAEGYGKNAIGGRGGQVIEVTNLNSSGSGSFRQALESSGPRTVVFRVSGTIELDGIVRISNPFITIAGQTAPGDGVTIKGMLDIRTNNVVIRYLRVRPGPTALSIPDDIDAIQMVNGAQNVILDHMSLSWATDEVLSIYGKGSQTFNITVQHSLIAESLNCPTPPHSKGCHGKGLLIGGGWGSTKGSTNISILHNLLAHHADRNPLVLSEAVDIVNNVMYNNKNGTTIFPVYGPTKSNIIGNYYMLGPNSPQATPPVRLMGDQVYQDGARVFLKGNIAPPFRSDNSKPEIDVARFTDGPPNIQVVGSELSGYNLQSETDAFEAKDNVLASAGAIFPVRDSVDTRVINDVINGSGSIINMPSQVGGYPNLISGALSLDSDKDGMPDNWEVSNGLNSNNSSDGSQDANGDGYTNLEEYLNSLVSGGTPLPDDEFPEPPSGLAFFN